MLPSRSPNRFAPRVEARSQVLHYGIPVVGTGMSLNYASDRVPGRRAANQIRIPLKGDRLPHDVEEIALEVTVGERQFTQRFPATQASYTYTWEPPGGTVPGNAPLVRSEVATVRVGYVHRAIWPRLERIEWREFQAAVGLWDARRHGTGGWTLTPHHAFDPVAEILYVGDGSRRHVGPVSHLHTSGGWRIPSEDTSEIYAFDTDGGHRRTLDSLTGGERLVLTVDAEGRLESVGPPNAELCRVERGGAELGLVAPGGARTSLTLDESGYLGSVVDPAGGRVELRYAPDGLLSEVVDPRGNAYRFRYDELGRLTSEEHPDGGGSVLSRTVAANGFTLRRSTATGLEFVYGLERLRGGVTRRVTGCCAGGGQTISVEQPDGRRALTYPDGSTVEIEEQPDPRFGGSASILKRLVRRVPSGLTGEATVSREVAPSAPDVAGGQTSASSITDLLLLNGREYAIQADAATGRLIETSPEGRATVTTVEGGGRITVRELSSFSPLRVERDALGRVLSLTHASTQINVQRDARGRPLSMESSAGRAMRYEFDDADRLVGILSPSSRRHGFEYDASGNLIAIVAPSRAAHRFAYGPTNRWTEFQTVSGERYMAEYDADGRPALSRYPSGREVRLEYDEVGWLHTIRSDDAIVSLRRDAEGRLSSAARAPTSDASQQEVVLSHDGPLVTSVSWRGPASGTVAYGYDADFRLASIALDEATNRELERDRDGLITRIGPFRVTRDGPGGAVSSIADDRLVIETEFDRFGRAVGRVHRIGERAFYQLRLEYDDEGTIRGRHEALAGHEQSRSYAYDLDGQLVGVDVDGSPVERYTYDESASRVRPNTLAGAADANVGMPDRTPSLDAEPREVDRDGMLRRRGSFTFDYGARGELLQATQDANTGVRYDYDAFSRLVARTDASGTEQYLYHHLAPFPQLLASRSPAGVLTEYFFDSAGRLIALLRGGTMFYVACDQVGTPRIVVDARGEAVKLLEHGAFGMPVADSNPGFELCLGFAGGLADARTGLVRFGRRTYDPGAGSWASPDPAGFASGDSNLHRYVWNDPINLIDRAGTQENSPANEQQDTSGPSVESQTDFLESIGVGGNNVDTSSWNEDYTDNSNTPQSPSHPLTNLAGSEPTPGGEYWQRGRKMNKYTWKGRWSECQVSVGGSGLNTSYYSPDSPGTDPGGAPNPEAGPKGVRGVVRF